MKAALPAVEAFFKQPLPQSTRRRFDDGMQTRTVRGPRFHALIQVAFRRLIGGAGRLLSLLLSAQ